jgi:lipopolysaccharide export system protein LptA
VTAWQRRARFVAAAVAIGGAAGAYWMTGTRRTPPPPPGVTELPPAVTARVTGGEAEQTSGRRQDFSLEFAEQTTYTDGRTVATGLKVTVRQRDDRTFLITSREGTIGSAQSSVRLNGDVVLTGHDGLVAKSQEASYADGEGVVRAPGPVSFERGRTHGAGIGFTFDKRRDVLAILDRATAHIEGGDETGTMDVSAGTFTDARRDRYLQLEREARVVRPGQTLAADTMLVYLLPDRDEPDAMELRGSASISGGRGFGALRAMRADNINIDYADDGRTVQHLTLAGQASITLAGQTPSAPGQRLSARWIDIALGADGGITNLVAREGLSVSLPAAGTAPARTIRAAELTGDGVAGAGLTGMRFTGGVDFREAAGAGGGTRTARSSTLTLALSPGGAAERATFAGDTTFEDGSLRATASEARYLMAEDRLVLVGRPGAPPRVTDTGLEVQATDLAVTLSTNALTAAGGVSSVMQPAASRSGTGTGRTPALLAGDQPLFAAADALEYDSAARRAVYTGHARLWQGATDIRAASVALDEQRGDLTASGGVTSTLALASGTGATPGRGTIARATDLRYDDEARTATYTGGAHMSGPEGDLSADRIALVLAAAGRTLERIEGYGSVVAHVAARDAKGGRLTYHAADERYVLTGAPVTFTEDCRVTTGRTLTFFGTAGKLIVDGNEAARTVTKGGGRCTPPSPPPPR